VPQAEVLDLRFSKLLKGAEMPEQATVQRLGVIDAGERIESQRRSRREAARARALSEQLLPSSFISSVIIDAQMRSSKFEVKLSSNPGVLEVLTLRLPGPRILGQAHVRIIGRKTSEQHKWQFTVRMFALDRPQHWLREPRSPHQRIATFPDAYSAMGCFHTMVDEVHSIFRIAHQETLSAAYRQAGYGTRR